MTESSTVGESGDPVEGPFDTPALLSELRRRVAMRKASGSYAVDQLAADINSSNGVSASVELEQLREIVARRLAPAEVMIERSLAGRVRAKIERYVVRGASPPLLRLNDEAVAFDSALLRYVAVLGRELAGLTREVADLKQRLEAATDEGAPVEAAHGEAGGDPPR